MDETVRRVSEQPNAARLSDFSRAREAARADMRVQRCPLDAYPMLESRELLGGRAAETPGSCTNPWHPHHPGACPKCGNFGFPKAGGGGLGNALAECENRGCRHRWKPDRAAGA